MSEEILLARMTPFFVADGKGVCVARPVVKAAGGEIDAAYELAPPEADGAWAEAADVLAHALGGASAASPLIVDDPASVILRSSAEAYLFSAPPGAEPGAARLAALVAPIGKRWYAAAPDDAEHVAELTKAGAHLWRVQGLRGTLFASRDPAPEDARVIPAVPRAASKLTKLERAVRLLKADEPGEQRFVLGIVLVPETVDSQGDVYSADEIRRACHGFMQDYQNVGHMHRTLINGGVKIVECYLAPIAFEINGEAVPLGTWLLGLHVLSDEVWQQVKSGALTGLSIGGYAQRVRAQDVPPQTT